MFIITHPDRSRSRQICWARSVRSAEKERVQYGGETRKTKKYATLQNQFKMHAAKCRTKLVASDNKNWAKITFVTIILLQKLSFCLPCCRWAWQLIAYVTCKVRHGRGLINNLSMKSDFSQTHPSRSGFDSECEAFRAELILNEIKQVGSI